MTDLVNPDLADQASDPDAGTAGDEGPGTRGTGGDEGTWSAARLLIEPVQRATSLGSQVAGTPIRMIGAIAEPRRAEFSREVRRSLGVPTTPKPLPDDPAKVFLPLDAVARRVHGDLPSMMIAGLSSLLLQSLHPLTLAGVEEHSTYREDPIGRLRRTAAFVGNTTYGTKEDARRAIELVKRVHRGVRGIAPDGRTYDASDPELLTWVHVTEVSTFLSSAQRFGPMRFSREECDAYYRETAVVARALGATWVPRSADEVTAYLHRVRSDLYAGPQALAARDYLLRGVSRRPEDRAVYAVIAACAVSLLPAWARAELRLPNPPLVDRLVVVPIGRIVSAGLRWAVGLPGASVPSADTPA
jgi:uncharacterized protein (DUF2236 family)